jgi:hypothetical protein
MDMEEREQKLQERLEKVKALEAEVLSKERSLKETEKTKKQILLRIAPSLWQEIAAWADDDYRSINSQIEFLLSEAVSRRKK